jgi:prepilin-type N-terminal cleavage/methylation domain-containing protein
MDPKSPAVRQLMIVPQIIPSHSNRGITLLEVLIALGILAIGLSSVVALVPAARSQGVRAVILDRASHLAANTLADAATFGLLRSDTDTLIPGGPRPPVMIIDPAGTALSGPGGVTHPNVLPRITGIYTGGSAAPAAAQRLIFQGRDDVTVAAGATADDPPINQIVDDARGFEGRMTSLLCLSGAGAGPYRASVIVFHNRDPTTLVLSGTVVNSGLLVNSIAPAPPAGRTITDIVKPGVVLWDRSLGRFHQAVAVSRNADSSILYLTLTPGLSLTSGLPLPPGGPLTTGTHAVEILPDSVGLAERMFTAEGVGAFTQ